MILQLNSIKEQIKNDKNMTEDERQHFSLQGTDIVEEFLANDPDLVADKTSTIINSLNEIDSLLYDVANQKGNTAFGKESKGSASRAISVWSGKGDILISFRAKTGGFAHGHAGILSTTKDKVIEALPKPGVVHQSASKYWSTVPDEQQYYVKNAPDKAYINAVNYAMKQVGDPYKLKTTIGNESQWYCSKLVYKACKSAGYSIGGGEPKLITVLPYDIAADYDTVSYKKKSILSNLDNRVQ